MFDLDEIGKFFGDDAQKAANTASIIFLVLVFIVVIIYLFIKYAFPNSELVFYISLLIIVVLSILILRKASSITDRKI